jgi:hypothetical protein
MFYVIFPSVILSEAKDHCASRSTGTNIKDRLRYLRPRYKPAVPKV